VRQRAVCDLETGVDWCLEKTDQCGWLHRSRRNGIRWVTWRNRMEELYMLLSCCRPTNFLEQIKWCCCWRCWWLVSYLSGRRQCASYVLRELVAWVSHWRLQLWPRLSAIFVRLVDLSQMSRSYLLITVLVVLEVVVVVASSSSSSSWQWFDIGHRWTLEEHSERCLLAAMTSLCSLRQVSHCSFVSSLYTYAYTSVAVAGC